MKLTWNCKTKRSWLETVLSPWSEILKNSSCVYVAVYEILTALEPGGNSETSAFDAVSISSVQKRELFHVIAQAPFRQGSNVVVS